MKKDKLYIIKCHDENESFIKVGTTFNSLNRRFSGKKMPYKWCEILSIECGTVKAIHTERVIDRKFESYIPKIKFSGYLECFNIYDLEKINEAVELSTQGERN